MSVVAEKAKQIIANGELGSYAGVFDLVDALEGEQVSQEMIEQRRWQTLYETIIKVGAKYLSVIHLEGSTENCDGNEPSEWEIYEVVPKQVTVTQYAKV